MDVHTLEAIYAKESSFGTLRRKRGIKGAAGDFQLEKDTATRMGLTANKENDQHFDVDDASAASAKYLKTLDDNFRKKTTLGKKLKTIPVKNKKERTNFAVAAYNAGEGRIAKAQAAAEKAKEIQQYVDKVTSYSKEFSKKSKAKNGLLSLNCLTNNNHGLFYNV